MGRSLTGLRRPGKDTLQLGWRWKRLNSWEPTLAGACEREREREGGAHLRRPGATTRARERGGEPT